MPHAEIPIEDRRSSGGSSISSIASFRQQRANELDTDSTNSSLRSELEFDGPNVPRNYPPQPYYLPIVIPAEPSLDELLKRVSGRNDLENVESLKLRVISYMVSLSRLASFSPRLTSLNLDGSVLSSLRDLGCGLTCLKHLNVSNCGLTSLDGTNGIPTVEVLIADGNLIEIVNPLGNLILLKKLSMKDNRIRNLGLVSFLGLCPNLQEVNLEGNPITRNILYRSEMHRNVKMLELLDGKPFEANKSPDASGANSSESEIASSLSEGGLSERDSDVESDNNIGIIPRKQRPATSQGRCHIQIRDLPKRPESADISTRKKSLASGDPVCGSIVSRARLRKQQAKSAWTCSDSSSSLSSSDYSYEKKYPHQLPQTSVDLELGVIGAETPSTSDSESNNSLKVIAKKWRSECQRKKE